MILLHFLQLNVFEKFAAAFHYLFHKSNALIAFIPLIIEFEEVLIETFASPSTEAIRSSSSWLGRSTPPLP